MLKWVYENYDITNIVCVENYAIDFVYGMSHNIKSKQSRALKLKPHH